MSISSNSIAVRQFYALARGEMGIQKPRNPFRVATVGEQVRYCLRCCGPRHFDVIIGLTNSMAFEKAAICRCCGKVVAHPNYSKVHWIGPASNECGPGGK